MSREPSSVTGYRPGVALRGGQHRRIRTVLVATALGVLSLGCTGSDTGTGTTAAPPTDHMHSDTGTGTTAAPPTDHMHSDADGSDCASAHAHHLTMMWNPTMADEMIALGCPWPYEPYLAEPTGAGAAPGITVPYAPRRYDDIWAILAEADTGVCAVAPLADPSGPGGFAFGFSYSLALPQCAGGPAAQLEVREYVSVGDRDAAALADHDEHSTVIVLGRWVIVIVIGATGDVGDAIVTTVAAALVELGGQNLTG